MGYETHIVIGHLQDPEPEYEENRDNPFKDGSGYPYKKDKNGDLIPTGRTKRCLIPYVHVDLHKLYYAATDLLHTEYRKKTKENVNEFIFFYHSDGNTEFTEDNYGDPLVPIPFVEVLEAVCKDAEKDDHRRIRWLRALLESMEDDAEELTCVFYGS